jgi:hypothetical protein
MTRSRSTTVVRILTAAFVACSAAIGFAPVASAGFDVSFTPTVEAWYQLNPSCLTPAGCVTTGTLPVAPPAAPPVAPPAASPYPAGSLHVGVATGKETARSYLAFPFAQLEGKTVSSGTLTIPLDLAPADGNASPETSKARVCLTTSSQITATEGTIDSPPSVDCALSVPANYVATPQPHLQANLTALAPALPTATGLVLLPDDSKAAQTDAWRVVFSAHNRADAAKTAPASVTLLVEDAGVTAPVDQPVGQLPGVLVPPVTGTGFAPPPPVAVPVPGTTEVPPTVSNPAPVAAVPVTTPRLVTVGYAYPAVWLLPLAFLVLVPATARALTKDLSVP